MMAVETTGPRLMRRAGGPLKKLWPILTGDPSAPQAQADNSVRPTQAEVVIWPSARLPRHEKWQLSYELHLQISKVVWSCRHHLVSRLDGFFR